jgi:hypothetical protein
MRAPEACRPEQDGKMGISAPEYQNIFKDFD